jgi:uncharacterized protein
MRPELAQFADEVQALMPDGAEVLDVHTHLGVDEDGHALDLPTLLRHLDQVNIRQACVFALHDPDRAPAYRVPNDRVLGWAGESDGRLIPFCRLDPTDNPIAEAERCLARGARGLKLHPRAQSFAFGGGEADDIFRVAEEAGVPILIHAGRGMPPVAEGLCDVALRHPGAPLILAHGAIADQAVFASRLADHPAAFFDTSVFGPLDLLELFARVPPERIVYGSDPPYGRPMLGLYLTLRGAMAAGLDETQMRALLGGTIQAVLDRRPPATSTPPKRPRTLTMAGSLARVYVYCAMAFAGIARGHPESARETLDLALSVCRDPDPGAAAGALGRLEPALASVIAALDTPGGRVPVDALYLAMSLAATEPATAAWF